MACVHTSEASAESPPSAWYIQWLLSWPPAVAQPDSLLLTLHPHAAIPLRYDVKGLSVSIPGCQGREDKAVRPLRA